MPCVPLWMPIPTPQGHGRARRGQVGEHVSDAPILLRRQQGVRSGAHKLFKL
jgi:hypothetical protein